MTPREEEETTTTESEGFGKWFTGPSMDLLADSVGVMMQADPNMGPAVENLIMSYPTVSKDVVVGMAVAGQIPEDSALLDSIIARDLAAQQAAADHSFYAKTKSGLRRAGIVLEDLYNNAPFQTLPRIAINMHQGASFMDAVDQSTGTIMGTEMMLNRLGFESDYGSGFFPSEELVPQGAAFWQDVKQSLLDGNFEGSVEEQIIAAEQAGRIKQGLETGLNAYAIQRAEWQSTMLYKTTEDGVVSVPYSPGTGTMIMFTTPGTMAFDRMSGFVDAGFRLVMEPGDVALNNLGDIIKAQYNPSVHNAFGSITGRGSKTMRAVLEDFGVGYIEDPIQVLTKQYDEITGERLTTPAKGVSDIAEGTAHIDPDAIERQWLGRVEAKADRKADVWTDPSDPYVAIHVEAGRKPSDVRDELGRRGGVEAEGFLTVEHELVHVEIQGEWFDVRTLEDGTKMIVTDGVSKKAPQELKDIAARAVEEGATHDEVIRLAEEMEALNIPLDELTKKQESLQGQLNRGIGNKTLQRTTQRQLSDISKEVERIKKARAQAQKELLSKNARKAEFDDARRTYLESHAVEQAWNNMMDGSWKAPKMLKKFKRKHGLSNIMRPFAKPKAFSEYTQTAMAQRTFERLAETTNVQDLRKMAKWADGNEILALADAKTPGDAAEIMRKAFEGSPGAQSPTIGKFRDSFTKGMDSWEATHRFMGGTVAGSIRRQGRRWGAATGNNVLSITDQAQTLDTIYNTLATAGVDQGAISSLQRYAIKKGHLVEGVDYIQLRMQELLTERIIEVGGGVYDQDDVRKMFDEWSGYEKDNRIYMASNAGRDRPYIFDHGQYKEGAALDDHAIKPEAAMEAQFATTSRVVPDVRRVRRLTTRRRSTIEGYKKTRALDDIDPKHVWSPLGFNSTNAMHAGDWTFGVWRDFQLMRGGWAARVIPEESLRFAASGYAALFNNPLDYLISVFNNIDYKLVGDELSLADMLKHQETLGAAQLQEAHAPIHKVKGEGWRMASREVESDVGAYWGGMSRRYVTMSHDRITTIVARMGRDDAIEYLLDEKQILKEVSTQAKKGSSLELIANADELSKYIDVEELTIAQMGGGEGIWFDPVSKQWLDLEDTPFHAVTDRDAFPNKDTLRRELDRLGAEQPNSRALRLDLEAAVDEARGFNIDQLNAEGRAALVTKPGDQAFADLIANQQLDDILLNEELPYGQLRAVDDQLRNAYERYGATPPRQIPVANSEMMNQGPGVYRKTTDRAFYWLNSVPSRVLNRQPFFQQAFGNKLAQIYHFGDSEMRTAIDNLILEDRGLANAYRLGERKMMKDFGITKMPRAFDKWERGQGTLPPPKVQYSDAIEAGMYDVIPLEGGGHLTAQWHEAQRAAGNVPTKAGVDRGMYAYRHGDKYAVDGRLRMTDDHVYHGSRTLIPQHVGEAGEMSRYDLSNKINDLQEEIRILKDSGHDVSGLELDLRDTRLQMEAQTKIAEDPETLRLNPDDMEMTDATSAGLAFNIDRSKEYSGFRRHQLAGDEEWVSVFYKPHLDEGVRTHLDEVGDVEQAYSIEDVFPRLKDIPDMTTRWPEIREYHKAQMGTWVEDMWEARAQMFDELASDYGYEMSVARGPTLPGNRNPKDGIWRTSSQFLDEGKSPTVPIEEAIRLVANDEVATMYDNTYDIGAFLNGGPRKVDEQDLFTSRAIPKFEEMIGRELTQWERLELTKMAFSRHKMDELVISQGALKPMMQVPIDTLMSMMDTGYMATTPRAIGDSALMIEANMDQITLESLNQPLDYPVRVQAQRVNRQIQDMNEGSWYTNSGDTFGMEMMDEKPGRIYPDEGPSPLNDVVELDIEMTQKSAASGFPYTAMDNNGAPNLTQDYALYVKSPKMRQFLIDLDDWGLEIKMKFDDMRASTPEHKAAVPSDELVEEYREFLEATELAEKGRYAFQDIEVPGSFSTDDTVRPYENYVDQARKRQARMADDDLYSEGSRVVAWADEFMPDMVDWHVERPHLIKQQYDTFNKRFDYERPMLDVGTSPVPGYDWKEGRTELKSDFKHVDQPSRNAAVERVHGPTYGHNFDMPETNSLATRTNTPQPVREQLEDLMQAAKHDSIEETKDLFYDLSNKSNIADALKFVFPFGDAWYEVLSRWAKIMNPVQSGGQSLRNVRRATVTGRAAKQSGFISTNEYGEESFNWPVAPGSMMNLFIPNSANVQMAATVPVSSMMFIDPSARGILMPGTSPVVQLSNMFTAPMVEDLPVLSDMQRWFSYGSKDAYEPGSPEGVEDVLGVFAPTVTRRIFSAVFDQGQRETVGTTKLRLFESLMASGDSGYDPLNPQGAAHAWAVADTAGTWLSWLRVLDAWFLPGQPQYTPVFVGQDQQEPLTYDEMLEETGELTYEQQLPIVSIARLTNEYRVARDMFGDSEADLYMIERYGIHPFILQSSSQGIVERPVSWGGVEWVSDNEWLKESAPLTLAWTVPTDADDTFSSKAWNNLFGDILELEGLDNTVIRRKRTPSEIHNIAMRSAGYDQLHYQQDLYDKALSKVRAKYGEKYASNDKYRITKRRLDQTLRKNKETIFTQYPIIHPRNQGKIVGETQGITSRNLVDEIMDIGNPGTAANNEFRKNLPELAEVAEFYAKEFRALEAFSLKQDKETAGSSWWINAESDTGQAVRKEFTRRSQEYFGGLTGGARDYAQKIHSRLMDSLIKDWEWIDKAWAPEVEIYPSILLDNTVEAP